MSEFYDQSRNFVRSIISQRMILIRFNKCQVADVDKLRRETEQLNNELQCCQGDRSIAHFIYRNYIVLKNVLPHSPGFEKKEDKLEEYYHKSFRLIST
jgi:hypothetical protein